jgi:drug/metabolite transporter (DMT)-like permease
MRPSLPVLYALLGAALFGVSTPFAQRLAGVVGPFMLAGLLYAGSGLGLTLYLVARSRPIASALPRGADRYWIGAAILLGGVVGPVLLMSGLRSTSGSVATLLLNLESVLTALIAWVVFSEHFPRRIAFGLACIAAGGLALTWTGNALVVTGGELQVLAACLCWAIDNNLTRKASANDAILLACLKGLVAGTVNLALAVVLGERFASPEQALAAGTLGLFGYGASLALFVVALRGLGAARAGAYFAVSPFVGAVVALAVLGDPLTPQLVLAGVLMALGVWLHLTEEHTHPHEHQPLEHAHWHAHDEHHLHDHEHAEGGQLSHTHVHSHPRLTHRHPHYPDIHHGHDH